MIKKYLIALSLVVPALCVEAQPKWPAVTPVTKPWTRWWWLGSAVNPKDLTQNMESYAGVGLGGLEITPIYGIAGKENEFIDYLSPKWMDILGHTLKEAKRLNLQIDMATGSGWPFGGGPLIGPEDACKDFQYKTWSVKGGETLKEAITFTQEPYLRKAAGNTLNTPEAKEAAALTDADKLSEPYFSNKNLQALAIDQIKHKRELPLQVLMAYNETGTAVDLTAKVNKQGQLDWTAPAGNWTLYGLFMGWHGKLVERAAPGAEGDVIDHFSQPALTKYLGRFDKAFAGKDLSYLRGFFNDSYEVDDARGQSNYTPTLFDEFKKRRGYDLRQHLPALLAKTPDEIGLRVLYDYRQTIADLLLEKFTIPWHQWAKAKGKIVRNQSHGSPANILDLYGAVDIPETEGTNLLRFKFAASTTHVMGKPLCAAEAATWLGEHFKSTLGDVKLLLNKYFLGGVNHIVYHGTSYSPATDPWPGYLFYAAVHFQPVNPFWKDFSKLNNYVTRCQSFLQAGKQDNDVLLYFPFSDKNSEAPGARGLLWHYDGMEGFEQSDFNKVAEELTEKGYAWDLISDKQVQQLVNAGAGLKAPGGVYKTIVLPNVKYLPAATWTKLHALANAGATILVYNNYPAGAPGMEGMRVRLAPFKAKQGNNLLELMEQAKLPRETMYDGGLQCIRRAIDGGKYYFITNTSDKNVSDWVPLANKAVGITQFDPMTERTGIAKIRNNNKGTEVWLQLQPGESVILQTSATAVNGAAFPYYNASGDATEISGTWKLSFISGGPTLPAATTLNTLSSWTGLPDTAAKIFSGTALYTIRFPKPAGNAANYLLDLGKVDQSAQVRINGKPATTLIGPLFQMVVPANWLTSDNELKIEVSNGMANRIADMDKKGVVWKKFYNTNMPSRLPANRGADGNFTAINWEPESSGLLGPVTLTPLSLNK